MLIERKAEKPNSGHNCRAASIIAKVIRILSVPPVMVTLLIAVILLGKREIFHSGWEIAVLWICLALIPALAYPIADLVPKLRRKGREGERNAAFITSAAGYLIGIVSAVLFKNPYLIFITGIYVCSVILLLMWNKLFKIRSSGHGCSVVGPLAISVWLFGLPAIPICLAIYAAILWASLYLKRHTLLEFLGGSLLCLISMLMSYLICLACGLTLA